MKPFYAAVLGAAILIAPLAADRAIAQTPSLTEKLNAYIGCINRISERSYQSRSRYFSWADKKGPTGAEDHLRHIHDLRHIRLQEERREGQCDGAARCRA